MVGLGWDCFIAVYSGFEGFIGLDDIFGDVGVLVFQYSEMQLVMLQFLMLGSAM